MGPRHQNETGSDEPVPKDAQSRGLILL